jgi:predicted nucleic acid-binding protein
VEGNSAACSINVGEALYRQMRTVGSSTAREGITALREDMRIVDPDWSLVEAAAQLKARGGLSFADAFCIATAERLAAPLWTGDPEILALETEIELVDLR